MNFREYIADKIFPEGRERRDRAERAANTDELTLLANRRALALALTNLDNAASVVLFDANNFGQVNKQQGHEAGDALLREIAYALRSTAKHFGCAARVFRSGGDEFVCLIPALWAAKFRDAAELKFGTHGDVSISGTIGISIADADASLQTRKAFRKMQSTFAHSTLMETHA